MDRYVAIYRKRGIEGLKQFDWQGLPKKTTEEHAATQAEFVDKKLEPLAEAIDSMGFGLPVETLRSSSHGATFRSDLRSFFRRGNRYRESTANDASYDMRASDHIGAKDIRARVPSYSNIPSKQRLNPG